MLKFFLFCCFMPLAWTAPIQDKALICGVCKNVEYAIPNTIHSAQKLGSQFQDYRVIIYENNSVDQTRKRLQSWADTDPHVIFLSETLSKKELRSPIHHRKMKRTEQIARARNKVLDLIFQDRFDDYKYVIWADLDFMEPWDVENIVDSIVNPEQEWDAIFANGAYDLYAYRSAKSPIGPELLGKTYWQHIEEIAKNLNLEEEKSWRPVYSAFGGLGIYKREAMKGCYYSGLVTKNLEKCVLKWLKNPEEDACLLKHYEQKIARSKIVTITNSYRIKGQSPENTGMYLKNNHGLDQVIWFSSASKRFLPITCEHVPFHASMAVRGHDRLFINPRIRSNHPSDKSLVD